MRKLFVAFMHSCTRVNVSSECPIGLHIYTDSSMPSLLAYAVIGTHISYLGPEVIKSMFNSTEHEIYPANNC